MNSIDELARGFKVTMLKLTPGGHPPGTPYSFPAQEQDAFYIMLSYYHTQYWSARAVVAARSDVEQ